MRDHPSARAKWSCRCSSRRGRVGPIATASVPEQSVPKDGAADGDGAGDEEAIGAADDGEADDARAARAALAV